MEARNNFEQTKWILQKSLLLLEEFSGKPKDWNEIIKKSNELINNSKHNYFCKVVLLEVLKVLEQERE